MHLLVNEPPRIVLAQFLKAFKQVASRRLRGPREKFWQDRYYDSNVYGEKARSEVIRYIHRNPVKRGMDEAPIVKGGRRMNTRTSHPPLIAKNALNGAQPVILRCVGHPPQSCGLPGLRIETRGTRAQWLDDEIRWTR